MLLALVTTAAVALLLWQTVFPSTPADAPRLPGQQPNARAASATIGTVPGPERSLAPAPISDPLGVVFVVLDASTRKPIPGARVYESRVGARALSESQMMGSTGQDGTLVLDKLSKAASLRAVAVAESYQPTSHILTEGQNIFLLERGVEADLSVHIGDTPVAGATVFASKFPIHGALESLGVAGAASSARGVWAATTDSRGRARLSGLEPGEYFVRARKGDYAYRDSRAPLSAWSARQEWDLRLTTPQCVVIASDSSIVSVDMKAEGRATSEGQVDAVTWASALRSRFPGSYVSVVFTEDDAPYDLVGDITTTVFQAKSFRVRSAPLPSVQAVQVPVELRREHAYGEGPVEVALVLRGPKDAPPPRLRNTMPASYPRQVTWGANWLMPGEYVCDWGRHPVLHEVFTRQSAPISFVVGRGSSTVNVDLPSSLAWLRLEAIDDSGGAVAPLIVLVSGDPIGGSAAMVVSEENTVKIAVVAGRYRLSVDSPGHLTQVADVLVSPDDSSIETTVVMRR